MIQLRKNETEAEWGFDCMHGPLECAGNVQQLCASRHVSNPQRWWQFVTCQNYEGREKIGVEDVAKKCAKLAEIDWDAEGGMGECVNGDEGKKLLAESVARVHELNVTWVDQHTIIFGLQLTFCAERAARS